MTDMTTDKAGAAESGPNDGEQSDTDSIDAAVRKTDMIEDILESGFRDAEAVSGAKAILKDIREDLERAQSDRTVDLRVDRLGSGSEIVTLEQGDEIVSDGPIAVGLPGDRDE